MSLQTAKAMKPIHNLYLDVTVPGVGSDVPLVSGVPTSGLHLGMCGPTTVTPAQETVELDIENQLSAVLESVTSDSTEISLSLFEMSAMWLRLAQNAAGTGRKVIFGGQSTIPQHSLCVVYESMAGSALYGYYLFYNVQLSGPSAHALAKGEFSKIEVTFKAKTHATYTDGRLFEHVAPVGFE